MKPRLTRLQKGTIFGGISLIVTLLVILQLWLLTATMNSFLAGEDAVILPAAAGSIICLGLNTGLLWYLYQIERR